MECSGTSTQPDGRRLAKSGPNSPNHEILENSTLLESEIHKHHPKFGPLESKKFNAKCRTTGILPFYRGVAVGSNYPTGADISRNATAQDLGSFLSSSKRSMNPTESESNTSCDRRSITSSVALIDDDVNKTTSVDDSGNVSATSSQIATLSMKEGNEKNGTEGSKDSGYIIPDPEPSSSNRSPLLKNIHFDLDARFTLFIDGYQKPPMDEIKLMEATAVRDQDTDEDLSQIKDDEYFPDYSSFFMEDAGNIKTERKDEDVKMQDYMQIYKKELKERQERMREIWRRRKRDRRAKMTPEQLDRERSLNTARKRNSLASMTPEQRQRIRDADAARHKLARTTMTKEKLEEVRAKDRAKKRKSRASLSPTTLQRRRELDATRHRIDYAKRKLMNLNHLDSNIRNSIITNPHRDEPSTNDDDETQSCDTAANLAKMKADLAKIIETYNLLSERKFEGRNSGCDRKNKRQIPVERQREIWRQKYRKQRARMTNEELEIQREKERKRKIPRSKMSPEMLLRQRELDRTRKRLYSQRKNQNTGRCYGTSNHSQMNVKQEPPDVEFPSKSLVPVDSLSASDHSQVTR